LKYSCRYSVFSDGKKEIAMSSTAMLPDGIIQLPGLIVESFEAALASGDYDVGFRLLQTLEKHLLRPGVSFEKRTDAVNLLVIAHRRLLESQLAHGQPVYRSPAADTLRLILH
jgi:hypothetical protein